MKYLETKYRFKSNKNNFIFAFGFMTTKVETYKKITNFNKRRKI